MLYVILDKYFGSLTCGRFLDKLAEALYEPDLAPDIIYEVYGIWVLSLWHQLHCQLLALQDRSDIPIQGAHLEIFTVQLGCDIGEVDRGELLVELLNGALRIIPVVEVEQLEVKQVDCVVVEFIQFLEVSAHQPKTTFLKKEWLKRYLTHSIH